MDKQSKVPITRETYTKEGSWAHMKASRDIHQLHRCFFKPLLQHKIVEHSKITYYSIVFLI